MQKCILEKAVTGYKSQSNLAFVQCEVATHHRCKPVEQALPLGVTQRVRGFKI